MRKREPGSGKNTQHMRKCTRIYEKLILKSLIECLLRLGSRSATPAPPKLNANENINMNMKIMRINVKAH